MQWVDVANVQDIGKGKMKLVEAQRKKVVVANVDGRFYAFSDRCPHQNAPSHLGVLQGKVIICPLHFSSFDVTTGKKLSEPKAMSIPPEMAQKLPADLLQMFGKMAEIMSHIETLDLETYETKTEVGKVYVKI
jgi:3-phenylpropionate/trans-cinnamate dioxygenase ferredoxin subunit